MADRLPRKTERAQELCERAIRLDPLAVGWVRFLQGVVYFDSGDHDRAIDMFLASDWEEKWPHLAAAYALTGQIERAREIARRTRRAWGESSPEGLDDRISQVFNTGGWYSHGNRDGSFLEGMRMGGFFAQDPHNPV